MVLFLRVSVVFLALFSSSPRHGDVCLAEPIKPDEDDEHRQVFSDETNDPSLPIATGSVFDKKGEFRDFGESLFAREKMAAFESDLSDLKAQLSMLIKTLQSLAPRVSTPPPERPRRVSRSVYGGETVSGYFGHIDAAAYGNCTCRGEPGPAGQPGIPGRDGRDGRDAPVPCQGPSSVQPSPEPGLTTPSDAAPAGSGGGVYVRWGRTVCPDGSERIYEGVVGGTIATHNGGGANYQCLPLEAVYDDDLVTSGTRRYGAYINGAIYQTSDMPSPAWRSLNNNGPPCAVCMATRRPTILMIPARKVCPSSSWTFEYSGLLMTERHSSKRTEFICVDRDSEAVPRTATGSSGTYLYSVVGQCSNGGSFPCGGSYHSQQELSCAVCSF